MVSKIGFSICSGPVGGGTKEFSSMGDLPFEPPFVFDSRKGGYVFARVLRLKVSSHMRTCAEEDSAYSGCALFPP